MDALFEQPPEMSTDEVRAEYRVVRYEDGSVGIEELLVASDGYIWGSRPTAPCPHCGKPVYYPARGAASIEELWITMQQEMLIAFDKPVIAANKVDWN